MIRQAILPAALGLWCVAVLAVAAGGREEPPDTKPPASEEEKARDAQKRREQFAAELKTAKDPVAVGVMMVRDPFRDIAVAGMDVLAEHWQDPRSATTLEELVEGPGALRDGFLTVAGEARIRLDRVRGRKAFAELMKGADRPEDRAARVREVFTKNPTWLEPLRRPPYKNELVSLLVKAAVDSEGEKAVDLLVQSRLLTREWATQHEEALLRHVKQLGPAKTLATEGLLSLVMAGKGKGRIELIESWLADAREESEIEPLLGGLAKLPDGRDHLLRLVQDKRRLVVENAVAWLRHSYPDEVSLKAVAETARRRKEAGAGEDELNYYRTVQRAIEKEIAEKKGGKP